MNEEIELQDEVGNTWARMTSGDNHKIFGVKIKNGEYLSEYRVNLAQPADSDIPLITFTGINKCNLTERIIAQLLLGQINTFLSKPCQFTIESDAIVFRHTIYPVRDDTFDINAYIFFIEERFNWGLV